ncbi:uncharacterized protein G2W53_000696 [Senna tora]|uniref:RNase H type-1 domain-containing protein n=1 Tax=Senna tora TaxID=362788 RepID=A0A835CHY3_9FABA|nr:uncharacterized protein G2W53_000696 [Senna tora]
MTKMPLSLPCLRLVSALTLFHCLFLARRWGIGCVLRNDRGQVLATMARRVLDGAAVEILEASAMLYGVEFARDRSCPHRLI